MDNIKTGALIRERRKEKGLTQRELAERLHVTDRAVSKWERGLCAPDIALLEPLSEALDLSVLELISGERVRTEEPEAKAEAAARSAIAYSRAELMRKLRTLRLRHVALAAAALAVLALIVFAALWRSGLPFILRPRAGVSPQSTARRSPAAGFPQRTPCPSSWSAKTAPSCA